MEILDPWWVEKTFKYLFSENHLTSLTNQTQLLDAPV